jgi:hypothetical protein
MVDTDPTMVGMITNITNTHPTNNHLRKLQEAVFLAKFQDLLGPARHLLPYEVARPTMALLPLQIRHPIQIPKGEHLMTDTTHTPEPEANITLQTSTIQMTTQERHTTTNQPRLLLYISQINQVIGKVQTISKIQEELTHQARKPTLSRPQPFQHFTAIVDGQVLTQKARH